MADRDNPLGALMDLQGEAMRAVLGGLGEAGKAGPLADGTNQADWMSVAGKLQTMWQDFMAEKGGMAGLGAFDPAQFMLLSQGWVKSMPIQPPAQMQAMMQPALAGMQGMMQESFALWQGVLGGMMGQGEDKAELPRKDRRFADPAWSEHPAYALLHQTYLMLAEYLVKAARQVEGVPADKRAQLRFATQALVDAMSPDNFLATNPVVLKRTIETGGQNLVKGLGHLINDLKRGQLTHTDANAFTLGENLAATPGKVVYETPLYQLIQYTPATETVLEVPLVIFPPWINRFYILDLTPKKSFIKWAVDQGISVFVVSWKSADASMAEVVWDDYIAAQMDAIAQVRSRLDVPSVHAIGYCVAGTTLAATLAILARRGEADQVKSATFFTAQVDFERAGELLNFIDDKQMEMIGKLSSDGYLDGRYLAAAFNSLRGKDLIWNYVVNNYLLGEDYPAFDLLHWNGDVTNLPGQWHTDYLRDLYRDNKLVQPDALSAGGTPIDLTLVETPAYVQAGKEDHIAPAESVWRITDHFKGDTTFLLAGSGHIAGVVNPPSAGKYQYWTGDSAAPSLKDFIAGASEHPGSWWPHWLEWLHSRDSAKVPAKGKRVPGAKGDKVVEDAPGRYVKTR